MCIPTYRKRERKRERERGTEQLILKNDHRMPDLDYFDVLSSFYLLFLRDT